MKLSSMDKTQLCWLAQQPSPMWGGHLERNEPLSDPQMRAWVENGLIEAVSREVFGRTIHGYIITDAGRRAIQ